MKIAFFTELPFEGKVDASHPNMRTEFAWMHALNAYHYSLSSENVLPSYGRDQLYDLGVIIFPKEISREVKRLHLVQEVRKSCKYVAFMQEGPSWYFQDLPIELSFWMYSQMSQVDFVLAHNDRDLKYYKSLLSKEVFINPTLMIPPEEGVAPVSRANIIVGGNLTRWYGGFNSVAVAATLPAGTEIWLPRMGRMHSDELYVEKLNHLPYMLWKDWIAALNKFKYAIHLNPNIIGGTFNLNCAYLGIPCIGNIDANTQRLCFPELSVEPDDLEAAHKLLQRLSTDEDFYLHCSTLAQKNYNTYFSLQAYKQQWTLITDFLNSLL